MRTRTPAPPIDPEVETFLALIRRLPERQRIAVALRYIDDLSVEDVARSMRVADGTVKALLFKARQTLIEELTSPKEKR
jgi:RNA polymerase sigma factor (sigma-70 family)